MISIRLANAVERAGRQRAVGFEISIQSRDLGGPPAGLGSLLQHGEPVAAVGEKCSDRYAVSARRIDWASVQRDPLRRHEVAAGPAIVPRIGKALRDLQDAGLRLVQPLLLEQRLDLRSRETQRYQRIAEG